MDEPTRVYDDGAIAIEWFAERCIHAGRCVTGLPAVFNRDRRPWIEPAAASADSIAAVIERCPSGALRFRRPDGGPDEQAQAGTTFTAVPNGPIYVRGKVSVEDEQGHVLFAGARVALCRCGHSVHKPFCDNTHLSIGFEAP